MRPALMATIKTEESLCSDVLRFNIYYWIYYMSDTFAMLKNQNKRQLLLTSPVNELIAKNP